LSLAQVLLFALPRLPAALRYLEVFRHLQEQAAHHGAGFPARHLELLVLILRSDVLHSLGGELPAWQRWCETAPGLQDMVARGMLVL
jgi:hypothetical protein